jgi:peroxiredoxin
MEGSRGLNRLAILAVWSGCIGAGKRYAAFMNDHLTPTLPGMRAPHFTLPRTLHESFSSHDVHGHPAILVFYPGDWEPISRQQLGLYQAYLPEFHKFGAALIGISVDSVWSHMAFGRALNLTFPLLSDFCPRGVVAQAYGVYRDDEGRSGRAAFVLDAEGTVHWSRAYPHSLNPGVDGILTALETMQAQE